MFTKLLCVVVALSTVQANADLTILHSPDSIQFKGDDELPQSLLKDIFSVCLGFTPKQKGIWNGMTITDPFHLAKAVVGVAIEGGDSMEVRGGKHYPMMVDEDEETTWQALSGRLEARDNSATLIRFNLGDGVNVLGQSVLGELKMTPIDESSLKYLSLENDPDQKLVEQIQLLNAISEKVSASKSADDMRDVYWFVLSGLPDVIQFHGKDSAAAKEASELINEALNRLNRAFLQGYSEKVLLAVFTTDAAHVRHARATNTETSRSYSLTFTENVESTTEATIAQETTESYEIRQPQRVLKSDTINISKAYDTNYPIMFNIFLWFGVAFVFALIAICITIADMDPGRDSIIYRMTSNRMKKDN